MNICAFVCVLIKLQNARCNDKDSDPLLFHVSAFDLFLLVRMLILSSTTNRCSNGPFKGDKRTL